MKYAIGLVMVAALVAMAGGCADKYESAISEQLGYLEQMNSILDGVKDKDSLEAAKPKLEAVGKKMKALADEMQTMGDPPEGRDAALKTKYEAKMKEQMGALMANMMRISQIEGADSLGNIFEGFGD